MGQTYIHMLLFQLFLVPTTTMLQFFLVPATKSELRIDHFVLHLTGSIIKISKLNWSGYGNNLPLPPWLANWNLLCLNFIPGAALHLVTSSKRFVLSRTASLASNVNRHLQLGWLKKRKSTRNLIICYPLKNLIGSNALVVNGSRKVTELQNIFMSWQPIGKGRTRADPCKFLMAHGQLILKLSPGWSSLISNYYLKRRK